MSTMNVRTHDVGTPCSGITAEHRRRPGIVARGQCVAHDFGDIGGIAQPHVEALRADRRQYMCSLANERDTRFGKFGGLFDHERKPVAAGFNLHFPEDRMRTRFNRVRQFLVAERHEPLGFFRL